MLCVAIYDSASWRECPFRSGRRVRETRHGGCGPVCERCRDGWTSASWAGRLARTGRAAGGRRLRCAGCETSLMSRGHVGQDGPGSSGHRGDVTADDAPDIVAGAQGRAPAFTPNSRLVCGGGPGGSRRTNPREQDHVVSEAGDAISCSGTTAGARLLSASGLCFAAPPGMTCGFISRTFHMPLRHRRLT